MNRAEHNVARTSINDSNMAFGVGKTRASKRSQKFSYSMSRR
jgi:hypothetical protein